MVNILNNLTQSQAEGIFIGAGAFVIIFLILLIIAEWKLFTKAGEAGWKSLIPIYNLWVAFKIVGLWPAWSIILLIIDVVVEMIASATSNGSDMNTIATIAFACSTILGAVINIVYYWKLAKAYGRSTGTFIGLLFFPNIFTLILAFGSAKYNKKSMYKKA